MALNIVVGVVKHDAAYTLVSGCAWCGWMLALGYYIDVCEFKEACKS